MKRSECAAVYYDLVNSFMDFATTRQRQEYNVPDLSFWDNPAIGNPVVSTEPAAEMPASVAKNIPLSGPASRPGSTAQSKAMVELATRVSSCTKCPQCSGVQKKSIGQGNIYGDVMVVSYFNNTGNDRVLSDNVHNLLGKMFAAINIDLNSVFMTNLIKCSSNKFQINRNIIENCLFHLDDEIKIINPKIIYALGGEVVSSLFQRFIGIDQTHGQILNYRGFRVFCAYHPADVMQNANLRKPVWDDLKKFRTVYDQILSANGN